MAIKIGTISISLSAETASFQEGMTKASQIALNSSRNIERSFAMMGAAIVASTGAAIAGLGLLIAKTEETVFSMQKMAQQSGVTMESFSKLAYVAKVSGMPLEQMAVIMTRISGSSYEAASGNKKVAAAYKDLKISVMDTHDHFKTADQLVKELAKSLDNMKDSAGKTGLEKTLIGRSGPMAAEFLHNIATRMDELSTTAEKLGVVFSQGTADGAQKLHESLLNIEEAGLGLSVRLLSSVAPALDKLSSKIIELVSDADNMKKMESFGKTLAQGIELAGNAMEFMVKHATAMKVILGSLVGLRVVGIFGPMIASATTASGVMGKLGLALLNLSGSMLGVRKIGNILAPLIADTFAWSGAVVSLARSEGVATAATYAFKDALANAKVTMAITFGAIGALIAGIGIFAYALVDAKSKAEENANMAVTWGNMWHGAISNVKEDFNDLGILIAAITTGDFSRLKDMKWTSLDKAAGEDAKKHQLPTWMSDSKTDLKTVEEHKKDAKPGKEEPKEDVLAKKLAELKLRAEEAQRALALVGASPEAKQQSEILEKYNMFLVEHGALLAKLTPQKRGLAQAEAHASIETVVADTALTKYREAMLSLSETTANTTEEHLAMADAVGKSAKAMQDAQIAAQVNKEFQQYGTEPNAERDHKKIERASQLRAEMDAANLKSDKITADSQARELAGQDRINAAILKGSDAREDAALQNQKDAIRADFKGRGDTGSSAEQAQLDFADRMSEAKRRQADLEKAAGMSSLFRLQEQQKAIADAVEAAGRLNKVLDQREVMAANKQAMTDYYAAQDKAILATGSAMDGLKVAMRQMARDTESNAQKMHDVFTQAIDSMNGEIAKLMTGQKANFAGVFRGIGEHLAKASLQKAESALFGGAGKPDGSQGKPWWVRIFGQGKDKSDAAGSTNAIGDLIKSLGKGGDSSSPAAGGFMSKIGGLLGKLTGSGGGGGGWLSSLIGTAMNFLPMMAEGGTMISGMPTIVGEKGPELFLPPNGGSIVPNHKLKSGGSGAGGHTYNIDARGSNDPAQTVALIDRYMTSAAPQITESTMKAMSEHKMRTPLTAGR